MRVVIEMAGLYGLDFALRFYRAGVALRMANPRAARHVAQAMIKHSKNDHIDVGVLRQFVARLPFVACAVAVAPRHGTKTFHRAASGIDSACNSGRFRVRTNILGV